MPASPKPVKGTAASQRASRKRAEAKADKLVYLAVTRRDGQRCRVCRCWVRLADIQRHHIVYRSAGGQTTTANVISLCPQCHLVGVHGGKVKIEGNADTSVRVWVATSTKDGFTKSWAHYESKPYW